MPSAPSRRATATSSGSSTLASIRMRTPSRVSVGPVSAPAECGTRDGSRASRDLADHRLVRVDDQLAALAVDGHDRAGEHPPGRVVQPDDRRHLERAREDRGVVACGCRHPSRSRAPGPVDLRRHRRRELVGDQDERALDVLEQVLRPRALPQVQAEAADRRPRRRPSARAGTGPRSRRRPAPPPRTPAGPPIPRSPAPRGRASRRARGSSDRRASGVARRTAGRGPSRARG